MSLAYFFSSLSLDEPLSNLMRDEARLKKLFLLVLSTAVVGVFEPSGEGDEVGDIDDAVGDMGDEFDDTEPPPFAVVFGDAAVPSGFSLLLSLSARGASFMDWTRGRFSPLS